jgi:hypothetical protein
VAVVGAEEQLVAGEEAQEALVLVLVVAVVEAVEPTLVDTA